jgi:hypothetical protein
VLPKARGAAVAVGERVDEQDLVVRDGGADQGRLSALRNQVNSARMSAGTRWAGGATWATRVPWSTPTFVRL